MPVASAAASVWHPLQPAEPVKTALPAAALVLELAPDVPDDELEGGLEDDEEPAPGTTL